MKRNNKTTAVKKNIIRNLWNTTNAKKRKVRFSRRQKIHFIINKLRQYSDFSKKKLWKRKNHSKKLETLKQQIIRNPENYNIVLDKQMLFEGNEFDISLKLFSKDNSVKFYQIQIITPKDKKQYLILTSRGNIGSQPVFHLRKFSDLISAFDFFKKKFERKVKEGFLRSDYTFLRQCNSRNLNKKLIKTYLITQLV
jgi:hypothetical protein